VAPMPGEPHDDEDTRRARAELASTLMRVADRLRTMPLARLRATAAAVPGSALFPPAGRAGRAGNVDETVADGALRAAQLMADLATGVERRDAPAPPAAPRVPRLADVALGDQVEVTGRDLLTAADDLPGSAPVWRETRRVPLSESLTAACQVLDELRRVL